MKAVVIREHGDLDRLLFEDLPRPEPGPKEVLIKVRACALNHLDIWVRRGVPGHKFPLPLIPGCDVAGVVEQLGPGASSVSVGDEVVVAPGFGCGVCEHCASGDDNLCRHYGIFGETCDGGCAEFVRVPDRNCMQKPENLDFEQAAAMPLVFLTAWHMLVERAALQPGMNVLIQAVGSGVGTAALQITKLYGARAICTAGSDAKLERALEMGADETINYERDDFLNAVKQFTNKQGVDIAIDHVGEPTIGKSIAALRKGGTLVTCGATAGFKLETDLRLIFFKSLSVLGSTMGSLGEVHKVMNLARTGRLKPVIHCVLPMSEIQEAHRLLKEREVFGKVVVRP